MCLVSTFPSHIPSHFPAFNTVPATFPKSDNTFRNCIRNQIDERTVFTRHICCEKEKKLKEYNFKMSHGILSFGANLHKWEIRNSSVCDVCDQEQTNIHLLFECKHVERLWTSVGEALGMNPAVIATLGVHF